MSICISNHLQIKAFLLSLQKRRKRLWGNTFSVNWMNNLLTHCPHSYYLSLSLSSVTDNLIMCPSQRVRGHKRWVGTGNIMIFSMFQHTAVYWCVHRGCFGHNVSCTFPNIGCLVCCHYASDTWLEGRSHSRAVCSRLLNWKYTEACLETVHRKSVFI